jgi:hypothetical protein
MFGFAYSGLAASEFRSVGNCITQWGLLAVCSCADRFGPREQGLMPYGYSGAGVWCDSLRLQQAIFHKPVVQTERPLAHLNVRLPGFLVGDFKGNLHRAVNCLSGVK